MSKETKEKGDELVEKFKMIEIGSEGFHSWGMTDYQATQCAIIAVEEIIKACTEEYDSDLVHWKETGGGEYWDSVLTYLKTKQ